MVMLHGGANLVSQPPTFANDGKRLLVCTGSTVTVLSIATTLPVLQLNGHTDTVTGVSVVPPALGSKILAVNHAWTSSLDATIRLWDFEVGNLIRTITVGTPIESMVIPSFLKAAPKAGAKAHDNVAFISVRWYKENQAKSTGDTWTGRVVLCNLSSGKTLSGNLGKTLRPQRLVVSPHGNLVGMPDKRKIWVWSVPDGTIKNSSAVKSTVLHHTKAIKVMAFDPTETVVAGGDETGRILCWYNVGERSFSANGSDGSNASLSIDGDIKGGVRGTDDAEACTTYHWHANEVKSLLYSVDGTYLFSGGAEGTLVIWQIETGKQQFLARLGGQLYFITPSPDPSVFAISCSDNAIRFVNIGTMNVEKSCQGIKPVVPMPSLFKSVNNTRVAFSPQGGKLVLPTDNVAVQFYDTVRDCELFEVSVAPRTNISGANNARDGSSGQSTFVTHVTFSTDGSVMATVDVRFPEGNIGGSACLKFWHFDPKKQNNKFSLNTMVDEPHGAEITGLVYHPSEHMVVSCSVDSTFKVWVTRDGIQENTGTVSAWRCRSVGSYRHKEMYSAAFSPDGSLLGVATEELITLWNPYSNGFVTSLASVLSPQTISFLAFVHNSKCIVAASSGSRSRMIVWHLPTLSVLWSCKVHVEALSVDPRSSHFGIMALAPPAEKGKSRSGDEGSRKASVAVFSVDSPTPVAAWSLQKGCGGTLFFASSNLLSSSKVQRDDAKHESDSPQSSLVVVMGSREYVVLNPYIQEDETKTVFTATTPLHETAQSAFVATYGKPVPPSSKEGDKDVVGIRAVKPWGDLLNASSHVFPSLTRISLTFMESLLEKNSDPENQVVGREPDSRLGTKETTQA
ncbi:unnamed protein product [Calypogeia fissa]